MSNVRDSATYAKRFAAMAENGLRQYSSDMRPMTTGICAASVMQKGLAFDDTIETIITMEILINAVAQSGTALRYVPEHLKTTELCAVAVMDDWRAIDAVPGHLRADLGRLIGRAIAFCDYTLYRRPNGLYQAGCFKNLKLAQALAHWGPPRDDKRAQVFRAALLKEQQRLAVQQFPALSGFGID